MLAQPLVQVQLAGFAKVLAGPAGRTVQCDQAAVEGAGENTVVAGPACGLRVLPAAHAAAVGQHYRISVDAGVVHPALATAGGVEGKHAIERGAVVQRIADDNGCHLQCALRAGAIGITVCSALCPLPGRAIVAGAVFPGQLQLGHVGRGYLGERREVAAAGAAPVAVPLLLAVGCSRQRDRQGAAKRRNEVVVQVHRNWRASHFPVLQGAPDAERNVAQGAE